MNNGKLIIYVLGLLLSCLSVGNIVIADTKLIIEPVSVLFRTADGDTDSAKCIIVDVVDLLCTYSIGGTNYRDDQDDQSAAKYLRGQKALRAAITKENIAEKLTNISEFIINKDDLITIAIFYFFNNYNPQFNEDDIPGNVKIVLHHNKVKQLTIEECDIAENIEQKMLMMRLVALIGKVYDQSISCDGIFLQYYNYLISSKNNEFLTNNQQWLEKYFNIGEEQQKWLNEGKVNNASLDAVIAIGTGITQLSTDKLQELLKYPHALSAINDANKSGTFELNAFSNKIQKIDDLEGLSGFIDKLGEHKFDVVIGSITADLAKNKQFINNIEQLDSVGIACLAGNRLSKKSCFSAWYDATKENVLFPSLALFGIASLALIGFLVVMFSKKYNTRKYQVDNIVISSLVQALINSRESLNNKGIFINKNKFSKYKKGIFVADNALLVEIFNQYFEQIAKEEDEASRLRKIVRAAKQKGFRKLSQEIRYYLENRGEAIVRQIIEPLIGKGNTQLKAINFDEVVEPESIVDVKFEVSKEVSGMQESLSAIGSNIEELLEYNVEDRNYSSSNLALVRIETNLISYIQNQEKEESLINTLYKEIDGYHENTGSRNLNKKAEDILDYIYQLREKIHEYQQIEKI